MKTTTFMISLLSFFILPLHGYCQTTNDGQVSASGTAEIKHAAELLRVQVDLTGKGKDMKEALAKLKERKEVALAQLINLGADKANVTFSEPSIVSEKNDRQRQIEMMMMQRRGGAKKPDPKNKQADPIVVSVSMKADVPLKAGSAEDLLQLGHTLQEKIKAADLGGLKESEKLNPKDEEIAEEMQEMNRMMAEGGEARRGEPSFMYVSKITPAEHDKALKDAFAKASAQATRLAGAAGVELGSLHSLQSNLLPSSAEYMNEYYARAGRMMIRDSDRDVDDKDDKSEAVGMNPAKVSLKVSVNAAFTIKPRK